MSTYPLTNPFGYPPQPPYPANTPPGYPNPGFNSSYPYPNQHPEMSANTGYLAAGYPGSQPYPNAAGYPSAGGYPNAGGYPAPAAVPDCARAGVNNPPFNPAISPSAPDLSQIKKIPEHKELSFKEGIVMPPPLPGWKPEVQERKQIENLPTFCEEDAREAALEYVTDHCCYGSKPAKNMAVTNITMMSAVHYKLESFGEKRESARTFVPYNEGEPIDGPINGPAPHIWDIPASPSECFTDSKMIIEVPHTAFVKPCHICVGNGKVRCEDCTGRGKRRCVHCVGRGRRNNTDNKTCTHCSGTGFVRCIWCHGKGQKKCEICKGSRHLKGFLELTVTWTNHVDDYISETSGMPKELVRQVTGQIVFEEENPRVHPIVHTSDQAVRNASKKFCSKHSTAFPNERILRQRHCLRLIPIGEVNYEWKDKMDVFYVYGYEHKAYFQNYPQKCCCCSIL